MSQIYIDTQAMPLAKGKDSGMIRSIARSILIGVTLIAVLVSPSIMSVCHAVTCEPAPSAVFNLAPVNTTTADYEGVIRVDEDWELKITQPDTNLAAPQVGTVMSPLHSTDGVFVVFLLNHRFNDVALGGTEVQFWCGNFQLGARRDEKAVLATIDETVTWTQRLAVKGSSDHRYLCFRVINGQSNTWGTFGGTEPLHMNLDTNLNDLSGYRSEFSVRNSGVTFASNRVAKLVLKAVRGYYESGELVFEETTPVVVYETPSD